MLPEAFVQGSSCHPNVLHSAVLAFNQIDYTLCLTGEGGRCMYPVRFTGDLALESVCFLDVITTLTVPSFAWLVSCEGDSIKLMSRENDSQENLIVR